MIKVTVKRNNDLIDEITIKGHAGYSEYGSDIVCASVSSMSITSINAIILIDKEAIIVKNKNGFLEIKRNCDNQYINKILLNLVNMLTELSNEYSKNIKIKEEES